MKNKEVPRGIGRKVAGKNNCEACRMKISIGRKYCGKQCYYKSKIGLKQSDEHRKSISNALKGKPKSAEHIRNAALALTGRKRPEITGEKHFAWKGDGAMYGTIHDWVSSRLGRPQKCKKCTKSGDKHKYQWANISGKYQRILSDWIRLCIPCHRKMDMNKPRASLLFEKKPNFLGKRIKK